MKYKSQKVTELIKEAMLSGRPREEREKLFEKVYDFMQTQMKKLKNGFQAVLVK